MVVYFFVIWVFVFVFVFFFFVSPLLFVTLVSAERYLAICHPIKHHLLKGTKRTIKLICIVFAGSFVFSSVMLPPFVFKAVIEWPLDDKVTESYPHLVKLLPSDYFLPGGVIFQIISVVGMLSVVFALIANFYLYIRLQGLK